MLTTCGVSPSMEMAYFKPPWAGGCHDGDEREQQPDQADRHRCVNRRAGDERIGPIHGVISERATRAGGTVSKSFDVSLWGMHDVSHVLEGQYLYLVAYGTDSPAGRIARLAGRMPRRYPQRFGIPTVLRPLERRLQRAADRTCPSRLRWCGQLVAAPSAVIAGLDWPPGGTYVFRHGTAASVETISIFVQSPSDPSPTGVLLGKADY